MNNITATTSVSKSAAFKPASFSPLSFLALFVTFFLAFAAISIASAQSPISVLAPAPQPLSISYAPGYDVTGVEATDMHGHYVGGLRQIASYTWEGFNQHGQTTHTYQEVSRDGFEIQLYNAARDLYFTLDMHSNTISYHKAHSPLATIAYNISVYDIQTKGFNVNTVDILSFSGQYLGQYMDIGHGSWAETNAQGHETYSFQELSRSEWMVDLYDASRGVYIYLDLRNNVISYQDARQAFDLYNIGAAYTFDQLMY